MTRSRNPQTRHEHIHCSISHCYMFTWQPTHVSNSGRLLAPLSSSSSRSRCCITHKVSRLCHRVFKRLVWCILSAIITTSRRINYIAVALIHKFTKCLGLCGSACNVPDGVWWCAKTAFTFRPIRTPPHVCVKGVDRSIDIYIYLTVELLSTGFGRAKSTLAQLVPNVERNVYTC